ncbi:MAG: hypothetical protein C5B48_08060 [Candidatus Rokuibacteriota bacterium]|nr:MAG: hypothetical protein C5B48_08060 [Candidatus Rokubacteria bacterium]
MSAAGEHELAAAYALHALDEREERAFEAHLRDCIVCAEELPSLRQAAAALAYAIEAPVAPRAVRVDVMKSVLPVGPAASVVPLWRRVAMPAVCALAAGAAAAAVTLGLWATKSPNPARALVVPVHGRAGSLVVSRDRAAVLVLPRLSPAPAGKTYEAWVVVDGVARPGAVFSGGAGQLVVTLKRRVPSGALVAVSLERRGGSRRLTGPLILRTETA